MANFIVTKNQETREKEGKVYIWSMRWNDITKTALLFGEMCDFFYFWEVQFQRRKWKAGSAALSSSTNQCKTKIWFTIGFQQQPAGEGLSWVMKYDWTAKIDWTVRDYVFGYVWSSSILSVIIIYDLFFGFCLLLWYLIENDQRLGIGSRTTAGTGRWGRWAGSSYVRNQNTNPHCVSICKWFDGFFFLLKNLELRLRLRLSWWAPSNLISTYKGRP